MKLEKAIWDKEGEGTFVYAIEEMAELTKAICKVVEHRGSKEDIAKEAADVMVTVGIISNIDKDAFMKKKRELYSKLKEKL